MKVSNQLQTHRPNLRRFPDFLGCFKNLTHNCFCRAYFSTSVNRVFSIVAVTYELLQASAYSEEVLGNSFGLYENTPLLDVQTARLRLP